MTGKAGPRAHFAPHSPAPSCTQRATSDGGNVPCSVITRVTRSAGVTSKAGFHTSTPSMGRGSTSAGSRSSMGMSAPVAQAASTVDAGAAT